MVSCVESFELKHTGCAVNRTLILTLVKCYSYLYKNMLPKLAQNSSGFKEVSTGVFHYAIVSFREYGVYWKIQLKSRARDWINHDLISASLQLVEFYDNPLYIVYEVWTLKVSTTALTINQLNVFCGAAQTACLSYMGFWCSVKVLWLCKHSYCCVGLFGIRFGEFEF